MCDSNDAFMLGTDIDPDNNIGTKEVGDKVVEFILNA